MKRKTPGMIRIIALGLALVLFSLQIPLSSGSASEDGRIRVGLMFDNLKTIRDTAPLITVSSAAGVEAGLIDSRQPAGRSLFLRTKSSTVMRFRLMQWTVRVYETTSQDDAVKKSKQLTASGESNAVIVRSRPDPKAVKPVPSVTPAPSITPVPSALMTSAPVQMAEAQLTAAPSDSPNPAAGNPSATIAVSPDAVPSNPDNPLSASAIPSVVPLTPVPEPVIEPGMTRNVYQIETGPYLTLEAARNAIQKMKTVLSGIPDSSVNWQPVGTTYFVTGTFNSAEEAAGRMLQAEYAGFHPVLVRGADLAGHPVWKTAVGGGIDDAANTKLKAAYLKALPSHSWTPLNWNAEPAVIEKQEWIADAGEAGGHLDYLWVIPPGTIQKLWMQSAADVLSVKEHSNRSYRGRLELFGVNDKMAVINDVSLDDYIASVLGAEMSNSWPLEALKAQAVTARTYALKSGNKYGFAQVSDTTYDQVYKGISSEGARTIQAAKETSGEVLVSGGQLIGAYFYSNSGGRTAAVEEIWGGNCDVCRSVDGFDDSAQNGKPLWGRIVTSGLVVGYAPMSSLTKANRTNPHGLEIYTVSTASVSVRGTTYVSTENPPVATIRAGEQVVLLDTAYEYNAYSWITQPVSGESLQQTMNAKLSSSAKISKPVQTFEVSKRGSSGRVTEIRVNGNPVKQSVPDNYRGLLGGLRSTLFEVDQMGHFSVLGKGGKTTQASSGGIQFYVAGKNGAVQAMPSSGTDRLVQNIFQQTRVISMKPKFRFLGKGFGHGVGLSQWGARQLAEQGWTYDRIVMHYYPGASIRKDGVTRAR